MYRAHYKLEFPIERSSLGLCETPRGKRPLFPKESWKFRIANVITHFGYYLLLSVIIYYFFEKYFSILEKSILIRSKIKNITLMDPFEFFKLENFKIISGLM